MPGADGLTIGASKTSGGPGDPQSLNRYAYVTNNPVKNTDPTGHCLEDLCMVEFGVVGTFVCGPACGAVAVVGAAVVSAVVIAYGATHMQGYTTDASGAPVLATETNNEAAPTGNTEGVPTPTDEAAIPGDRPRGPNPYGSRGSPAHRETINQRIGDLEGQGHEHLGGGDMTEEYIRIPGGGGRRPDITMRTPDGGIYRENVGRTTTTGAPVARERRALDDIERATGSRPGYTRYDRRPR